MSRTACKFYDPGGSPPDTYSFVVNPSEETERSVSRSYTETARSGNGTGPLLQQGGEGAKKLTLTGTILRPDQDAVFAIWYQRCRDRSIVYEDWAGHQAFVLIESYAAPRSRAGLNLAARGTYLEHAVIRWTMTLRVLRYINGPWAPIA